MGKYLLPQNATAPRNGNVETVIVALIFLDLSLNVILGTFGAFSFIVLVSLLSLLNRAYLHKAILESWFLFLLPAYCILSVVWSSYPGPTLYYSAQYFITIYAAVLIAYTVRFENIIQAAFIGLGIYCILALLFGNITAVGADGEVAFIGLAGSKNQSADITLFSILFTLTAIITARASWRLPIWIFGLIALIAGAYSVALSRATSATLFLIVGVLMLLAMMIFSKTRATTRGATVLLIAFFAALIVLTAPFWLNEAVADALSLIGKDVTLTGRTVLWDAAEELISQKPILGLGYAGFWRLENTDAQLLWDAMKVKAGSPFNFHNTPLDLLVNLGAIGLVLFFLPVIYCVILVIANYIYRPNQLVILCLAVFICTLPRAGLEVVGSSPFNLTTLIFFLALAYGPILKARHSPSTAFL